MLFQLHLFATIVLAFTIFHETQGECCPTSCGDSTCPWFNYCDDCTYGKFCLFLNGLTLCGVGDCNIFGCNCDGGCRKGIGCHLCSCKVASSDHIRHADQAMLMKSQMDRDKLGKVYLSNLLAKADVDGDGQLNWAEASQWVRENIESVTDVDLDTELKKIDLNGDGILTVDEIDPPYTQ